MYIFTSTHINTQIYVYIYMHTHAHTHTHTHTHTRTRTRTHTYTHIRTHARTHTHTHTHTHTRAHTRAHTHTHTHTHAHTHTYVQCALTNSSGMQDLETFIIYSIPTNIAPTQNVNPTIQKRQVQISVVGREGRKQFVVVKSLYIYTLVH